ncbi:unnamed protein product [Ambrosiozyma monospora]|uniref:Unnamed protein product n=1 Tax=Ambrosiozyma monospora TaxID=43982 RepID=A0ACB5U401_AMBMO|nr:unnamed protein product [Ambrosiozyma monospora]
MTSHNGEHQGFDIDVPVTNLDIRDDEDFRMDDDTGLYDDDNVSLDMNVFDGGSMSSQSLLDKVGSQFNKIFRSKNHSSGGGSYENIEMFDRNDPNRSRGSFANANDLENFNIDDLPEDGNKKRRKRLFIRSLIMAVVFLILVSLAFKFGIRGKPSDDNDKDTSDQINKGNSDNKDKQTPAAPVNSTKPINQKTVFSNGTHDFYSTTLLISLDGFHPHYISEENTPFMNTLLTGKGYGPPYMIPSNPTVTFVNHWTLVTGLKPIYHGITGNKFFDEATNDSFINTDPSSALQKKWWGGEPIWSTAEKQGFRTAVHMWPGSEVDLGQGLNPSAVDKFNQTET